MGKKSRINRFQMRKSGLFTSLSHDLIECAFSELTLALDDKHKRVFQAEGNHYSPHALGSILLLLAGLEAWLNEAVLLVFLSDESAKELVGLPITKKFRAILGRAGDLDPTELNDLELLVHIRHEIAHFIPYIVTQEDNVPRHLQELQRRGLFITSQDSPGLFHGCEISLIPPSPLGLGHCCDRSDGARGPPRSASHADPSHCEKLRALQASFLTQNACSIVAAYV